MDPASATAVIEAIVDTVGFVHKAFNTLKEYRQNLRTAEDFLQFLDNMVAVLKEQRQGLVPPAGLRILHAIETECVRVENTASTFLQRHMVIKLINASSTVAALRESRVALNEHWTLYLASMSAAGASPAAAMPDLRAALLLGGGAPDGMSDHMEFYSRALGALCDAGADRGTAERHLSALSRHSAVGVTDEGERQLAAMLTRVQQAVSVPAAAWGPTAGPGIERHLTAMRKAMDDSIAGGMAGLQAQLELVSQQNIAIAAQTQALLQELQGAAPALRAVAYGIGTAGLEAEERVLVDRFSEAVVLEERCVIDQTIMACPGTNVRFSRDGDAAPTHVPGCKCTVTAVAAATYRDNEKCGVCGRHVKPDGALKVDKVALQFLDDLDNDRLPAIPKFDMEKDFVAGVGQAHGQRTGGEGVVQFGTVRGKPAAVKTVEFAQREASQRQWRCRRHVLLNSVCTQRRAARASQYVCGVVGLCWEDNRAHIAMPLHKLTLEEHVDEAAPLGMPLHLLLELCCALTQAIYEVHRSDILHCDINPANVLLAEDGSPRLTDFGMSHVGRDGLKTRTSMGHTLEYAAPEQVAGHVNKATDIYALGRTLVFAATGVKPSRDGGQKMPQEPQQLRDQLKLMTGNEETRKGVNLLQVLTVFRQLLSQHGPMPLAEVQTVHSLGDRLEFGDTVDMRGRDLHLADSAPAPAGPPPNRLEPHPETHSDSLSFTAWRAEAATGVTCWDLWQQNAVLCNVTFHIPAHGVLRVHAGSDGGTWREVCVQGGAHSMVLAHGPMLFDGCTFDGCTLMAETLTAVVADSCKFANARVAVCAAATGGKVTLSNSTVTECQNGIVATGGAAVTLNDNTAISCAGDGSCLAVQGNGSSATVKSGCTMTAYADTPSSVRWRGCIAALHGASVRVDDAELSAGTGSRGVGGLLIYGRDTKATLRNSRLSMTANAVLVDAAASAKLEKCNLSGGRHGLFVSGVGAHIHASDCTVSRCAFDCADIRSGATMHLEDCTLSHSTEHSGVSVYRKGSFAKLLRCAMLSNAKWGLFVAGGGRAEVTEGRADHNMLDGAYVFTASTAVLTGFKMAASKRGGGLIVSDPGSRVDAQACDFSVNALHGARAYNGGVLRAVKCSAFQNGSRRVFSGTLTNTATSGASGSSGLARTSPGLVPALSGSGPMHASMSLLLADYPDSDANACGFYAYGEGSTVDVSQESSATYNCAGGYIAAHGAKLVVSGSTGAHNGGPGAAVRRGASGTFQNCEFVDSRAGSGVEAYDVATTVDVKACRIARNARCGVSVQGGAKATVKSVEVTENKGDGLLLQGIGSRGDVEALVAAQNEGCGTLVQQRAELDAVYCTLKHNARAGVRVNACGRATVRSASIRHTSAGSGVDVAEGESQATLVSCEVVQNHEYGAFVRDSAVLEVWGSMAPTKLEKNRLSNVRVESRGFARLHDSFLCASLERSGLNVEGDGSAARAANCTLSGNALCGAIVQDGASIECEKVTAHGNLQSGVCVQIAAAATLTRVKLSECRGGSGLLVHGRGSSARLTDCQAEQNSDAGMQAQHGARVTAQRCSTARNGRAGAAVDAGSVLEMKKCKNEDPTPFTAPKGSRGLVRVDCTPA